MAVSTIYECFLISAFGNKPLLRDPTQLLDFDALQQDIKEAVQAYERTHSNVRILVRRSDDYAGGVITQEFYEQLYRADLVIAEISSPSLNVYYEVGVRMALRRHATILLALEGTPLPFDLREARVIFYQPGKLQAKVDELHRLMEARLGGEVDSPIYVALPDLEMMQGVEIEALREQIRLLQGITSQETYGLKIVSPGEGAQVGEWTQVIGTFRTLPPHGAARLFNKSPSGHGYWPQTIVELNLESKTWTGRFHLGASPPEEGIITITVVGKAGSVLWDYYEWAGERVKNWPPIQKLTDDIVECDHVWVVKPKKWFLVR